MTFYKCLSHFGEGELMSDCATLEEPRFLWLVEQEPRFHLFKRIHNVYTNTKKFREHAC